MFPSTKGYSFHKHGVVCYYSTGNPYCGECEFHKVYMPREPDSPEPEVIDLTEPEVIDLSEVYLMGFTDC